MRLPVNPATIWAGGLAIVLAMLTALPGGARTLEGTFTYTALGDSAARGVGATAHHGYVEYLHEALEAARGPVELDNRAVSGASSTDLLSLLKRSAATRTSVWNAELLTISIGGNNLLPCGFGNFRGISSACAARGVATFKRDWPSIMFYIRRVIGAQVRAYVITLYNPYRGNERDYPIADRYIQQINAIIQDSDLMDTYNYRALDVYADFQGKLPDGSWKVCAWTHFCERFRDPHPTDAGHAEIARLHELLLGLPTVAPAQRW